MRYSIRVDYAIQKGRHGEKIDAMVDERDGDGDAGGCRRADGRRTTARRVFLAMRVSSDQVLIGGWGGRIHVLTEYSVHKPRYILRIYRYILR
jgi:hypothetical protein